MRVISSLPHQSVQPFNVPAKYHTCGLLRNLQDTGVEASTPVPFPDEVIRVALQEDAVDYDSLSNDLALLLQALEVRRRLPRC